MRIPLFPALLFAALAVRGEITNVVDLAAWCALGTGETNGWTVANLDAYADASVRFNTFDDRATSPNYVYPILRVETSLRSSSTNATRYLTFAPSNHSELSRAGHDCAKAEKLERQSFSWTTEDDVHQFSISVVGSGSTGWGLGALSVICDDSAVPRPTGLSAVATNSNAFTAFWTNPVNVAMNTLCVSQQVVTAATYEELQAWDFIAASNANKSAVKIDDQLSIRWPGLSGYGVQIAAQASGFIQIGTYGALGEVRIDMPTNTATHLLLNAARHDKDDYGEDAPIFFRLSDGRTNAVTTIHLDTVPRDYAIPLGAIPSDAQLVIHATTNNASRTQSIRSTVNLYSIALVADYVSAVTNSVCLRIERFSARDHFFVRDLTPGTFDWFVAAETAEGAVSKSSALQEVTLAPDWPLWKAPGLFLRLR